MALTDDHLSVAILDLASDNDGLWEFTYIGGERQSDPHHSGIERVSANPHAFRDLHQPMIDLVREGYITIRTESGDDLETDEAVEVLGDAANWAHEVDGYWVTLTTRGEAVRTG